MDMLLSILSPDLLLPWIHGYYVHPNPTLCTRPADEYFSRGAGALNPPVDPRTSIPPNPYQLK
jgi:hypothetical protein